MTALHSPATAITDYVAVARAFGAEIEAGGGGILLSTPISGVRSRAGVIEVRSGADIHSVDRLVLCAGLQADRVSQLADGDRGPRIVPFRGEYMAVDRAKRDLVPRDDLPGARPAVPVPRRPLHAPGVRRRSRSDRTRCSLCGGKATAGPGSACPTYAASSAGPGSGGWRRRHWRTGMTELRGSLSVRAYMRTAARYVPEIGPDDVVRAGAGVRAQAVDRDGSLVDDFRISQSERITSVRNAPSPAATSSLAIAEYVVDR